MSRILTLAAIGLAVGTAATLYQVKYEVRLLEQEARELHRNVTRERQAIQVLDAEWAFMNQPSRIQDLAERYLDLKPTKPSQITSIDRLPMRPVQPETAPGAGGADPLVAENTPSAIAGHPGVPMPTLRPQPGRAPQAIPAAAPQKPAPATLAPAKPAAGAPAVVPVAAPARPAAPAPAPATRPASAAPVRPASPAPAAPRPAPVMRAEGTPRATTVAATSYDDDMLAGIDSLFAESEASYPTGRR